MKQNRNWLLAGIVVVALGCCAVLLVSAIYIYPRYLEYLAVKKSVPANLAAPSPDLALTSLAAAGMPSAAVTPCVPCGEIPQTPIATIEIPPTVSYDGISFSFGAAIAQGAQPEIVPASPPGETDALPEMVYPEHYQFKFSGYPLSGTFHEPKILIYPVAAYSALNPTINSIVQHLNQVLAQKPLQADSMPFLPLWNAAQFMQANIKYLDFKNGKGVRYLSQYGQAFWPINNINLFYTFQGLTADGQWYVSAVMPVSHPSLPSQNQPPTEAEMSQIESNFEGYIATVEQQLGTQPDLSFTPDLSLLDGMIISMRVK